MSEKPLSLRFHRLMVKIGRKQNRRSKRQDIMVRLCGDWKHGLLYNKKTRALHFQKQYGGLEKRYPMYYGDDASSRYSLIGELFNKYKKYPWSYYADHHKDDIIEMIQSYFNIIEGTTKAIR